MKKPKRASRSLEAITVAANKGGTQRLSRSGASHRCRQTEATLEAEICRAMKAADRAFEAKNFIAYLKVMKEWDRLRDALDSLRRRRLFGGNETLTLPTSRP